METTLKKKNSIRRNTQVLSAPTKGMYLLASFEGKKTLTEVKASLSKILTKLFERKLVDCKFCDNGNEGIIVMSGNGISITLSIKDMEGAAV